MKRSLQVIPCLTLWVVVVAHLKRFPTFVTSVPSPSSDADEKAPTVQDIDRFLKTAFSVGNSSLPDVDVNSSVADQLTSDYVLGTHQIPRLDCYRPRDCADVQMCGNARSRVYRIFPYIVGDGVLVMCDLDTRCGGWTLIQRRVDGSVSFNKHWGDYMSGFGNLRNDFWMGLHLMNQLTSQSKTELLVDMSDYNGNSAWAKYNHFYISDEAGKCRLLITGYQGTAGDSFNQHNGMKFSTPDSDNDIAVNKNCAGNYGAGWWFGKCSNVNLNGIYAQRTEADIVRFTNIIWFTWRKRQSLLWVEMKVRPVQFQNLCNKVH